MPMGKAEVIALSEIRASSQWQRLRADLHERFDQWLDRLQAQLPDPQVLLAEVTKTVWTLRCAKYNGTFDQVFARLRG